MQYVGPGDLETGSLRQGDILSDVQLVAAINYNLVTHHQPANPKATPTAWTVAAAPERGFAAVLSHCCELDKSNTVKLTSVVLAPVRDVSKATKKDKLQDLISSNILDPTAPSPSFLKYFYLDPHNLLGFQLGAYIDFSKLFSVHKNTYDELLGKKILQLTEDARQGMALKLGAYFYRSPKP